MRSQLQVHQGSPEGFHPALAPNHQSAPDNEPFRLAPAAPNSIPAAARDFWARIDWVAVSAAGFVYAVAFAAWLYLAK